MLIEKIETDFKGALKGRNEIVLSTLRMLKAAIKNKEIDKKVKVLSEPEILEVIRKQIKQRRDSISEFEKAKRLDLVDKEKRELAALEQYLPCQLTEGELKTLIQKAIQEAGAKTKADMGKVMKAIMPQVTGKADGKQVSQLVSQLLP